MISQALLNQLISDQDQEWSEAGRWCRDNPHALAKLVDVCLEDDGAKAVTEALAAMPLFGEIVQRFTLLAIGEILQRSYQGGAVK